MPVAEFHQQKAKSPIPVAEAEIENLPRDPEVLTDIIRELVAKLNNALALNEKQKHQLELLLKARYGAKTEKFDPDQLPLFVLEELEKLGLGKKQDTSDQAERTITVTRRVNGKGGRNPLPDHLPRTRVEHDIPESDRQCGHCGKEKIRIGEDVSEQLEYVPASMYVIQHVCPRYACSCEEAGVVTAVKPMQPIEKGLAGPGLLAHVTVSKYGDHLPLNRLEGIFERHGVEIARSTMCGWMAQVANLVSPLYGLMIARVRASKKIHTDDTPVKVLDPSLPKTRTGRMWIYVGDEENPYNVFDYSPNRKRDHPEKFLTGYKGYLQADAYRGYDPIYAGKDVNEVGCWAHVRRKYVDAETTDPVNSAAAVAWIGKLYEIETAARGLSPPERRAMREEKSRPMLEEFRKWLDATRQVVIPKGPTGKAISYTIWNWDALVRYLEDGVLEIDNNAAERALRTIAVGRKNWLFAGSDNGGKTAAVLFSLTSTCKRHHIDPFAYLRDIFARISAHPAHRLSELLPDEWNRVWESSSAS